MSGGSGCISHRPGGRAAWRPVLIAGPTASGKSALALTIAERLGGVVINADSMQVYADLRILTARPTPAEEIRVPHRLYGHVDAAAPYSVGSWLADVERAIEEARGAGLVPIIVGGTGLYFKALMRGLSAIPPVPAAVRSAVRGRLAAEGASTLHAELAKRDPIVAARLRPADGIRVARALEVLEATGRSLADWHRAAVPTLLDPRAARVFLTIERGELWRRIDRRFEAMMAAGALEEVRALAARRLDPLQPVMKAHGVPPLIRALAGEIALADAIEEAKRDTRRYTKRQLTWYRHQLADWPWMSPAAAQEALLGMAAAVPAAVSGCT